MVDDKLIRNDIVWIISEYIGVEKCEIVERIDTSPSLFYYKVHSLERPGNMGRPFSDIFMSKIEAEEELLNRENADYKDEYDKIDSLEDLLKFMYAHMFSDEYTDWTGIKVAENKALEFGFKLKK